jgi:glycosyltransferase involved in cell wall biosynthesis
VPVDVSVVIPFYNGERYLEATLLSALGQRDVDLEVILVDDGSTDSSARVAAAVGGADAMLISTENGGVARARNLGLSACAPSSRFVLFLDGDDVLRPGAIAALFGHLSVRPELAATIGAVSRIDEHGETITAAPELVEIHELTDDLHVRIVTGIERFGYRHLLPVTPISSPGQCLVDRAMLDAVGGFDEGLRSCEDWDLWLRLARRADFGVLQRHVLEYRQHAGGKSKRHDVSRSHRDLVYHKNLVAAPDDEKRSIAIARSFGMYGYDMRLCARWCLTAVREREPVEAVRLGVRALRYAGKYGTARTRAMLPR